MIGAVAFDRRQLLQAFEFEVDGLEWTLALMRRSEVETIEASARPKSIRRVRIVRIAVHIPGVTSLFPLACFRPQIDDAGHKAAALL